MITTAATTKIRTSADKRKNIRITIPSSLASSISSLSSTENSQSLKLKQGRILCALHVGELEHPGLSKSSLHGANFRLFVCSFVALAFQGQIVSPFAMAPASLLDAFLSLLSTTGDSEQIYIYNFILYIAVFLFFAFISFILFLITYCSPCSIFAYSILRQYISTSCIMHPIPIRVRRTACSVI
jgi:hypothetical protein